MNRSAATVDDSIPMLDAETFRAIVLGREGRVAVEFMSSRSGYCRAIEPVLQQVARLVAGDETIVRINIAADPAPAEEFGIGGTPTFVMFLNGQEVGRAEGPSPTISAVADAVTGPFVS